MENNKENKARFFSQYWEQDVGVEIERTEDYRSVVNEQSIKIIDYLALKPLSAISDEDAIEVANIILDLDIVKRYKTPFTVTRNFAITGWPYIKVHHPKNRYSVIIDCALANFNIYEDDEAITMAHDMKPCNVIDFLRSKGYAVPFMGASVEELVEWGWVKLVNE